MYVLRYLIANTDWMVLRADYGHVSCHNADLYQRDSLVYFVPCDFDLSGLVNARYAFPDPKLRIKRVTQRRYRGLCTDRGYLSAALFGTLLIGPRPGRCPRAYNGEAWISSRRLQRRARAPHFTREPGGAVRCPCRHIH